MDETKKTTILKLEECERHFLLYAKGYYPKEDTFSDLNKIIKHLFQVESEKVSLLYLYEIVVALYLRIMSRDPEGFEKIGKFLFNLFPEHHKRTQRMCMDIEEAIKSLINAIGDIDVSGNKGGLEIELGQPNYDIFKK